MAFDKFLITGGQGQPPFSSGMQQDMRPWLIQDDAFENLQNAYVFRGRVKKRFGSVLTGTQLQSRLRINLGNTNGAGNLAGTVPGSSFGIGQMFSVGTEIMTVNVLGVPGVMLTTGTSATHTYNTTNGAFVIAGAAIATPVFFYPSLPVMGITQYESGAINNHPTYAFDPYFVYRYTNPTGWSRSGAALWNGQLDTTFTNFFWATNWKGATANVTTMFVTNFQVTNLNGVGTATDDPIWFTSDGSTWASITTAVANGFYFLPTVGAARIAAQFVVTARIILPFKNRLILLNTVENDNAGGAGVIAAGNNTNYPQRCRYSFNGSPLATNAWYEPNTLDNTGVASGRAAGASFIDAATDEQIISAEFIKDRLIVYFERSTWELAYTGNEVEPFVWNKLNTELGSQSLLSTVPFDKEVLTIGQTGIHSCNGSNVVRIDQKIPDTIFEFDIKNGNSKRVAGIRDYLMELVYWAVPIDSDLSTLLWNNEVLVYNYRNNTWAVFDDTFTAFGYLEQSSDQTWLGSAPLTWAEAEFTWANNVDQQERVIMAGNQEGYVVVISPYDSRNAPSMQITNIVINTDFTLTLTIVNNNLSPSDYIAIEDSTAGNTTGMTNLYVDYTANIGIYQVVGSDFTLNTVTVQLNNLQVVTGTYRGGATAARVSNPIIKSKQWNPYDKEDRNVYLAKIDFAVQRTEHGQITVDYFPSSTELSMVQEGQASGSIMGNNILETSPYPITLAPLEQLQSRLWHPIYFQSSGECIQLFIYMSQTQMMNPNIAFSDLEIEAFLLYCQRTS